VILKYALIGAGALVTKDFGVFASALNRAAIGAAVDAGIGLIKFSPRPINELSFDSTLMALELAEQTATKDPEFKKYYTEALQKYGKMNSLADADRAVEWTVFQQHSEINGNTARIGRLENDSTNIGINFAALGKEIKSIAKNQDKVLKMHKQIKILRAALEGNEARRKKQLEAIAERQRELESEFLSGQAVLTVFEKLAKNNGAPRPFISTLQNLRNAENALYGLAHGSDDPRALARTWEKLTLVVIDILLPPNGKQNPNAQIMDGIIELSKQIDELHRDLINRFEVLDADLAAHFANQKKMLDLILAYEQGQSIEIAKIREDIRASAQKLKQYFEAHFDQEKKLN
jgi:hypothetical protein